MELLPNHLRSQLPALSTQSNKPDPIAHVKLFAPDANWTWFIIEFDGQDLCFGLVKGLCEEFGYFSLSDLKSLRGGYGLPLERDLFFRPTPISQIYGKG